MLSSQSFGQIYNILENSNIRIKNKIPNKLYNLIYDNMDKNYVSDLDFNKENWMDDVSDEVKTFMALVYRDYIVSPNERNTLIKEEIDREEQLKREKYNPDNIFKNNNMNKTDEKEIKNKEVGLVKIQNENWYTRVMKFFTKLLNKFNL